MLPQQILDNWIESQSKIRQHSEDWHNVRSTTIGGSSVGTILGLNRYCTIRKFVEDKINNVSESKLCMNWGTLFEDILKECVEHTYDCKITGENMFVQYNNYITFSPDGLAVVNDDIVLFEFKCPYSRGYSKSINPCYTAQVQMGLGIIDIAKYGILVQGWFNKLPTHESEEKYHGIIGFYDSEPQQSPPINFFDISDSRLNEFVMKTINKSLNVWWKFNGTEEDFLEAHNSHAVGYLYWELKHVNFDKIEKSPSFLAEVSPLITKVVDTINNCKKNTSKAPEIINAFINDIAFNED